jgi:hypothetical protein
MLFDYENNTVKIMSQKCLFEDLETQTDFHDKEPV